MGIAQIASIAAMLLPLQLFAAGELRFCLRTEPKTFDPLLAAADEGSETIRYITGGVLIRFNRATQKLQPELAESWKVHKDGRKIEFNLRKNVAYSDGTPFDSADVAATFRRFNDPKLLSATADTFRSGSGQVKATVTGQHSVSIEFPAPVAGLEFLFDQLAIASSRSPRSDRAVLGPFFVSDYKPGQHVLLRRNSNYWKRNGKGTRLPYADAVRIDIVSNRESEVLRFGRGEIDFIEKLEPEIFDRLKKDMPGTARDVGSSLDSEFIWFNQVADAPITDYKRAWFRSQRFRRAVSAAISRADIIRLVYRGYASAAAGPISESNRVWFNPRTRPTAIGHKEALRLLHEDGFRLERGVLRDRQGNAVEFSLITNAESTTRGRIGALVQQDLKAIGIQVNFTPLEFQSLIERIMRTNRYEACLLGLTNIELDPNAQRNVWLSSSTHHAWNPGQKTPATPWEAEIDKLMELQAVETTLPARKRAFDRVQEIIAEQAPIVYLVHPNVLVAIAKHLDNAAPSALSPHLYWNIENLSTTVRR